MAKQETQQGVLFDANLQSRNEAERRMREISAICEISQAFDSVPVDDLLDLITRKAAEVMDAQACSLMLRPPGRNELVIKSSFGLSDEIVQESRVAFGSGVAGKVAQTGKPMLLNDLKDDPVFDGSGVEQRPEVVSSISVPLRDAENRVMGVLSIARKIPSKSFIQDDVRVFSVFAGQAATIIRNARLVDYTNNILRSIPAAVITLGQDGIIHTWNKAAERLTRTSSQSAIGKHYTQPIFAVAFDDQSRERMTEVLDKAIRTGERYLSHREEIHLIDGSNRFLSVSVDQLRAKSGDTLGLVVIIEDVTAQVRMENEMRRIAEMASVGELAANVAHEIRNPLSSIKGAAQFLRKEYADHASMSEFLDIIIEEVDALNSITTDFLDYARPARLNITKISPNEIVQRTLQFMQMELIRPGLELDISLSDKVPRIYADERQLEQALRNIFINSIQAMQDGGRLAVTTQPVTGGMRIDITDTGSGIGKDVLPHIFEPFFTTKTKGTGIGLAMVSKIVDHHRGRASVKSIVGKGTTVEIFLPNNRLWAKAEAFRQDGQRDEVDLFRRSQ